MKFLENDYRLSDKSIILSREEVGRALSDFPYYAGHYQQIVNKRRQTVPSELNAFQRKLASILLPMIDPKTRLDKRHNVVILKPRQVGASTFTVEFINYLCAFVEGFNHMNILHTFPVTDTVAKFYKEKVQPIITGVHPSLFPTMERKSYTSSITTTYHNIKGVPRDNLYELISANANSIRSATANIWIADECFTGNVEVLTNEGFKRLDSLSQQELVAQFDPETNGIEFVKPLRYINKPYNGDAVKWKIGQSEFVSTVFHDFVVGKRGESSSRSPKWQKVKACDVKTSQNYDFPTWGVGTTEHEDLSPLERLGIAVQADGTVYGNKVRKGKRGENIGWARCTVGVKRPCKIRRMRKLLKEADILYTERLEKSGNTRFGFDLPYSNPKLLSSFLSPNCSYQRARQILHEVLHWDGYGLDREALHGEAYLPQHSYYSSTVKENRDFVAAIALQAGQQVTASEQEDTRSENYSIMYRLHMNSRRNRSYDLFTKEDTEYNGQVYCVTVPTGCIVVKTGRDVWICGNCAFYKNPEELEAAISPAIPDNGFSLVIYLSTFDDKRSDYFLEKIKQAQEDSEDWTLLFTPWYEMYPEEKLGTALDSIELAEYDTNTIIPTLQGAGIHRSEWGDYVAWYHKKKKECLAIRKEYPTTLEEVLSFSSNDKVFDQNDLARQEENVIRRTPYSLAEDVLTHELKATITQASPLYIFKPPVYRSRYLITIDPIASTSEASDYFAALVWDTRTNEQMASLHGRNLPLEDWANLTLQLARLYNNAQLCPESNLAQALVAMIWGQRYYNWWYLDLKHRKDRDPGVRTTATTKPNMIEKLAVMLRNNSIKLHDQELIDELCQFEKVIKRGYMKMEAPKGKHDDLCMAACIYAATLGVDQLNGIKRSGWAVL